jgi:hemolysin-activating ACP:hemolysin acyltransferase
VVSKAASGAGGNGAEKAKAAATAKGAVRPRDARQARFAQSFAQIIAVLMRDANYRNMRIADLETMVLPPIMAGQFRLAQMPAPPPKDQKVSDDKAKDVSGVLLPVAVALWARVSANVDKALQGNLDKQARLHPADWASGDNIWLMTIAGDKRAIPKFLEQLCLTEFKDKQVKMRLRGADGKGVVKTLGPASPAKTAAKPAAQS